MTDATATSPALRWGLLGLRALTAAAFVAAGAAKLLGAEMMVATFEAIGWGQWFRLVTGALEVGAGVALFVPGLRALAALLLAATMVAAILFHLLLLGPSALPAAVLLVFCLVLAWASRAELRRLI
jgi:uncharacterized membrane protein YphA (DoxX/SURF4 family)